MWQRVHLSEQIRPLDTLPCCWEVKQPNNNSPCLIPSTPSLLLPLSFSPAPLPPPLSLSSSLLLLLPLSLSLSFSLYLSLFNIYLLCVYTSCYKSPSAWTCVSAACYWSVKIKTNQSSWTAQNLSYHLHLMCLQATSKAHQCSPGDKHTQSSSQSGWPQSDL